MVFQETFTITVDPVADTPSFAVSTAPSGLNETLSMLDEEGSSIFSLSSPDIDGSETLRLNVRIITERVVIKFRVRTTSVDGLYTFYSI